MSGMFASLKRSMEKAGYQLGITEEPEPTLLDTVRAEFSEATTMSYTTRFYGFCACFSLGILMSMMSSLFWGHPTKFGVTYTFGNLISICSMMFLFGPKVSAACVVVDVDVDVNVNVNGGKHKTCTANSTKHAIP